MDKQKKGQKRRVKDLAPGLNADPAWTAVLLSDLGIKVDKDGNYPPDELAKVLDRLRSSYPKSNLVNETVKELMGAAQESCRRWLIDELANHNITVLHREEHHNSRFTVQLPNGRTLWLATYVALKSKSSHEGQVGFRAGPGKLGDVYAWYIFIAQPFGRVYARSSREMHARWNKNHTGPMGHMSVTFSVGQEADLLENRIGELLEGRK